MRIVGGTLRGRKIEPPLSTATRPMMDRVREALFNILAHRDWGKHIGELFEDDNLHVLDAFCGTGALSFEAISWCASRASLFDKDQQALKIARQNAATLAIADQCTILAADATHPPSPSGYGAASPPSPGGCGVAGPPQAATSCKLIFLAPPYRKNLIPPAFAALDAAGWIAPHALIVCETAKTEKLASLPDCQLILARAYGEPMLHFMVR